MRDGLSTAAIIIIAIACALMSVALAVISIHKHSTHSKANEKHAAARTRMANDEGAVAQEDDPVDSDERDAPARSEMNGRAWTPGREVPMSARGSTYEAQFRALAAAEHAISVGFASSSA